MRAIPISLLVHSCTVKRPTDRDRDGNSATEEIKLSQVRVEPTTALTRQDVGETEADRATLFFDCVNSLPSDYIPREQDQILWNGQEFTVQSVRILYTRNANKTHHYEAGLV